MKENEEQKEMITDNLIVALHLYVSLNTMDYEAWELLEKLESEKIK